MPTKLYFSNNIESLAEVFAKNVAAQQSRLGPPAVIVPNPYLKKWLQLETARINGIAMNLNFQFLSGGLWEIVEAISADAREPVMIEPVDLQLMLYRALADLDPAGRRVKPLMDYLFNADGGRRTDYEKKIWQLTSRLARYFLDYELYREDMISVWMEGRLLYNTDMEAAQQHLYHAVFKKGGYRDALHKALRTLPQYWNGASRSIKKAPRRALYLFGKTQLSPFHVRMIYELGRHCDITIYQMNPCSEFWEDVSTPGEDRWERVRSIRIGQNREGDMLTDNEDENPLLKLWGKTGRETVKLLSLLEEAGEKEFGFMSEWIMAEAPDAADTCLRKVQHQVLRRSTQAGSSGRLSQDTSIQVAACPDIFREAEAVYNSILYNLDRDGDLKMTDIAVMAPDMDAYGPVLRAVFSPYPKRLSFSIIDSSAASDSLAGAALGAILEIASGSFTRDTVFELVSNPCFLEAWSIAAGDADTWLSWVDALNIFRDFNKVEDIDPKLNLHTWQQGLARLRLGRIMQTTEIERRNGVFLDYRNIVPFSDFNTADQRVIDAFNTAIELLHFRTGDLATRQATGAEWVDIIEQLIADFCAMPSDRPEELQVLSSIRQGLSKLAALDGPGTAAGSPRLSLLFVKEFIAENLTGIPGNRGGYLTSGVNISALIPKRQIPFKITYIMGMQEGIFPGMSDSSTLNLMKIKRKIGDVTRQDVNRYLFLETLLGCRSKLYITYVSKDLQRDQDFYPNSVVGQLITYLNNHVLAEDFNTVEVPPSGSSKKYLSPGGRAEYSDFISSCAQGKFQPVNYSAADRLLLLHNAAKRYPVDPAACAAVAEELRSRIPRYTAPQRAARDLRQTVRISIRDLARFLINPVESTLRWHHGIYDDGEEDRQRLEDEPFFSVYPHNYRIIADSLHAYIRSGSDIDLQGFIRDYYDHARLMSITPDGAFSDIDRDEIKSIIMERVDSRGGISGFVQERKSSAFYRNVVFGSSVLFSKPDMIFPPAACGIARGEQILNIELSGVFSFLWKHAEAGECETLVISSSPKPSAMSVVEPFLAYVAAMSGYAEGLKDFIGSGAFTIHVSYTGGIASFPYCLGGRESREYMDRLMHDFLDESCFDLLPLRIISGIKRLLPLAMKPDVDDSQRREYRRELARLINDDADRSFPLLRSMRILEVASAEVPEDAYDKVRDRLAVLLKPFVARGGPGV